MPSDPMEVKLTHRERVFLHELVQNYGSELKALRPYDGDRIRGTIGYEGIDLRTLCKVLREG